MVSQGLGGASLHHQQCMGCSHNEKHISKTLCGCCRKKKMWEQKIPNPSKSLLIQSYLGVRANSTFKGSLSLSLFQDSQ